MPTTGLKIKHGTAKRGKILVPSLLPFLMLIPSLIKPYKNLSPAKELSETLFIKEQKEEQHTMEQGMFIFRVQLVSNSQ